MRTPQRGLKFGSWSNALRAAPQGVWRRVCALIPSGYPRIARCELFILYETAGSPIFCTAGAL
eukprot:5626644-Prymnesium_polylepis.1